VIKLKGFKRKNNQVKFKMIHHVNQRAIDEMYQSYSPIFVLTTGRSGSKFVVHLLNLCTNVNAFHEPRPTLQYFSNYAFHHQEERKVLSSIIDSTRMELMLEVYIKNKIYVESNQCLTFFAPVIASIFKRSRFVHLVRHPADFVCSAARKGWHKNDSIWETGRVKLRDETKWAKMTLVEKLSWVWNITNQFIEEFKESSDMHKSRFFNLRLEDLSDTSGRLKEFLQFVGAQGFSWEKANDLLKKPINKLAIGPDEPPNMRKDLSFPVYSQWHDNWKNEFLFIVKNLAEQYRYDL
jgi:hypothetical protein